MKGPLIGIVIGIAFIGLLFGVQRAAQANKERLQEERAARSEHLCRDHGGWAFHHRVQVGFGAFQRICLCEDGTEFRIP